MPEPGLLRRDDPAHPAPPVRRAVRAPVALWLVDLDALPDHGRLGRFEARDHLGSPDATIRANVDAFLAAHGIDLTGGRVLMAANARALRLLLQPDQRLLVLRRASGPWPATIVEVHNTYGGRHAYLVHPDERGRARVDKQLYVSPFHGTDGWYDVAVPVPGDDLLHRRHAAHRRRRDVQRLPGADARTDGLGAGGRRPRQSGGRP